jgi:hypothetical protein
MMNSKDMEELFLACLNLLSSHSTRETEEVQERSGWYPSQDLDYVPLKYKTGALLMHHPAC